MKAKNCSAIYRFVKYEFRIGKLIRTDPYSHVLRICRKKERQSTSRPRIAADPGPLAMAA